MAKRTAPKMKMRMQRRMKKSRRALSLTKKARMPQRRQRRMRRRRRIMHPPRGSRRRAHHPQLARLMRPLLLATMARRIRTRLPPRLATPLVPSSFNDHFL